MLNFAKVNCAGGPFAGSRARGVLLRGPGGLLRGVPFAGPGGAFCGVPQNGSLGGEPFAGSRKLGGGGCRILLR